MHKKTIWHSVAVLVLIILVVPACFAGPPKFTDTFGPCSFASKGKNPYFILEPGFKLILQGKEGRENVRLVITVLDKTKVINGVTTRIVKEAETHDGELVEISRNYFAICKRNNSIFYFGEDTDIYENGVVVSHEGSWHDGENGARRGLVMPGIVLLGSRYQQEVAPDVAEDRGEIVGINLVLSTPAGEFKNCIKVRETTPLEPDALEFKVYTPGIGLIQDDTLKLVNYTTP